MTNKLLLSIPADPKLLEEILNKGKEKVSKVTLISIDFQPIEVSNNKLEHLKLHNSHQTVFNKKQDQIVMFDVVGLIVDIVPSDNESNLKNESAEEETQQVKKLFLIAHEVMFITKGDEKLISINGNFNILPDELISKVYINFSKLKSIDLNELEDYLTLSKDDTAIKAFHKLGSFFTAKKYEINNNIFNLIKHQEEAENVSKKIILKKIVAWEIRK